MDTWHVSVCELRQTGDCQEFWVVSSVMLVSSNNGQLPDPDANLGLSHLCVPFLSILLGHDHPDPVLHYNVN